MNIDIVCHHCGAMLEEGGRLYPKQGTVYIVPCSDCLDSADTRGRDRGYDEGVADGNTLGFEAGVESVRDDVKEMLWIVKEESCAELKDGATAPLSS